MKIFYSLLHALLLMAACFVAFMGFTKMDSAPQQAAMAGFACFLAILARIAQATLHDLDKRQ